MAALLGRKGGCPGERPQQSEALHACFPMVVSIYASHMRGAMLRHRIARVCNCRCNDVLGVEMSSCIAEANRVQYNPARLACKSSYWKQAMPLDYEKLMRMKFEPTRQTYTRKDTMLYALGLGRRHRRIRRSDGTEVRLREAARRAADAGCDARCRCDASGRSEFGINYRMLLHAEQALDDAQAAAGRRHGDQRDARSTRSTTRVRRRARSCT